MTTPAIPSRVLAFAFCAVVLVARPPLVHGQTAAQRPAETAARLEPSPGTERRGFEATAYAGLSIDTFSADELQHYLNPEASGIQKERFVAGFDFAYRLVAGRRPLWIYGETVHGARSADVDCKTDQNAPVCEPFTDVESLPERTIYILRNASSLEAFTGARWEVADVNAGTGYDAKVYLKAQAGFLAVEGAAADVIDIHHLAVGLLETAGNFSGSYLEAGWGKTDLYSSHQNRRLKVDGYLTFQIGGLDGVRPFVQMTVDADAGSGADSIQSYMGLALSLDRLFGGDKKTSKTAR